MDLKKLREAVGLTQAEAAERIGVGTQFISNIERRVAPLPAKHIKVMARMYKTDPEKLVRGHMEFYENNYRRQARL